MVGEHWRTTILGKVVKLQRGHDLPTTERKPGSIPVMGSSGITGYHDTARVTGPGVTVGRSGASYGVVCFSPVDYWPLNTCLYVTDFCGNDTRFAYYFLQSLDFSGYNSGSAQQSLNRNFINPIPMILPPLPIQERIAEILGRLDDKIEVNRRINRTLEAMAQALYQHWFVDFGPFQDGEFVESELGPIPAGWAVKRLDQVAKINPDTIRKGEEPNEILYVDIASVSPGRINEYTPMLFADAPSRARRLVSHGDTIWSGVRPGRRSFSLIQHPVDNLIVSTGFIVNRPKSVPYTYLYAILSTQEFTDYLERRATGAAYPAVRSSDFDEALIVIPPKSVLDQFHTLIDSWFEQRYFLHREEQQLAAIRDYLLPKLLSGEVPVHAAEEIIP